MRRHVERLNGHKLAIVFVVAIILITLAFLGRARQTAEADVRICHAQQQDRAIIRSILVLARRSALKRAATSKERRVVTAFYREALRLARPIDCGRLPSLIPLS